MVVVGVMRGKRVLCYGKQNHGIGFRILLATDSAKHARAGRCVWIDASSTLDPFRTALW